MSEPCINFPAVDCLCIWVQEWWGDDWGLVWILHANNIHRRCPHHGRKPRWIENTEDN